MGSLRTALLAATAATTLAVGAGTALRGPVLEASRAAPVVAPAAAPAAATPTVPAAGVARAALADWDVRRAAAWASGDRRALARLYTDGSGAGRRDRAMLRRWTERGLVVRGLRTEVLDLRVTRPGTGRLVLDVTDRVRGARAVGPGVRLALPRDGASRRRVILRSVAGEWRVETVRPLG